MTMITDLSWLTAYPIAHRGLYSHQEPIYPENSMAAFRHALDKKYAIELDVQVIADQEVIVFHDDNLRRMCGKAGEVDSLFASDLEQCPLRVKSTVTEEKIPFLSEVLEMVDGRVPLLIEIKRQPQVKGANDIILNALLGYEGPFAIQSFDPMVLGWFAKHAPFIVRGQLSSNFSREKLNPIVKYLLRNFRLNFVSKPHFLAYAIDDMPRSLLSRKRKKGVLVLGWTVGNQASYDRVKSYCDNIIFEGFFPDCK